MLPWPSKRNRLKTMQRDYASWMLSPVESIFCYMLEYNIVKDIRLFKSDLKMCRPTIDADCSTLIETGFLGFNLATLVTRQYMCHT